MTYVLVMTAPHEELTPHEQVSRALHFASILLGTNLCAVNVDRPEDYIDEAQRRAIEARWGDVLLPLAAEYWATQRYKAERDWLADEVRAGRCMDVVDFRETFIDRTFNTYRVVDEHGRARYVAHWPEGREPWSVDAYERCLQAMLNSSDEKVIQIWRRRAALVYDGLRAKGVECR